MCRIGVDLSFDDVEKELLKERELIFVIKTQLNNLLNQIMIQIRKLRKNVVNLGEDLYRKINTLTIEQHNENLNENNIAISILKNNYEFEPAYVFLSISLMRYILTLLMVYLFTAKYLSRNGIVLLRT